MCTSLDVVAGLFAIFFIPPSTALPSWVDEVSVEKHDMNRVFNKLLYDLVEVNQERLNAINKILKLDEYPKGLRSSGEDRDEEDPLFLLMVNSKNINSEINDSSEKSTRALIAYLRSKEFGDRTDTSREGLGISVPNEDINGSLIAEGKAILRGWKSCRKSAIKTCRKACVSASKEVCKDYKCSSRMKKAFKKHCKSSCDDKFND